jgi:hypothetical protein
VEVIDIDYKLFQFGSGYLCRVKGYITMLLIPHLLLKHQSTLGDNATVLTIALASYAPVAREWQEG